MAIITKIEDPVLRLPPRKRVAAYARVSMETEALLHSLSAQISHYRKLIQSNPEWLYAGVYADEGITGTSTKHRDEFKRLIGDCDAGLIDIVLVKSISRFARDTIDCLKTVRHLKDIGVEVRFEREGISTFSSDGEVLLTLLASFAQAESESISANVKWATRKRFAQGIPNGHKAPYGYKWDGDMFRIIPEQGEIVKHIFQQYIAGETGYGIAKSLKEQGIVGQNDTAMCDSTIRDIISNISYTGTMILQKNYITDGHVRKRNKGELKRYAVDEMYEPIISTEDYEKAVAIRQRRAEQSPNVNVTLTRFSGLMKCGNCGCGISRRSARNEKKWICNTRERRGMDVCDMRPLLENELRAAADNVIGTISDEEFRSQVIRIVVYGDRIEFILNNGKVKSVPRQYGGYKRRNGFSGKLICGECAHKLGRDTSNRDGSKSWGCTGQRSICHLRRLQEDELRRSASSILATADCEPAFVEQVTKADVYSDRIDFCLKDGTVKTWQRE